MPRKSKQSESTEKRSTGTTEGISSGILDQSKTKRKQKSILFFDNSLSLLYHYVKTHRQVLCWQHVQSGKKQISYARHEDALILWCQSNDVPKVLYDKRVLGAAYNVAKYQAYERLVNGIAGKLTDKNKTECNYTDFFEKLGLSHVESCVLLWWMSHRKTVLVQLAKDLPTSKEQPPMPIFFSPKGDTGKSYIVHKLCEPFGELAEIKLISDINDQFAQKQWSQLLIANFDEMAGLGKTDIRLLKQWTTKSRFTVRKMRSELTDNYNKVTAGIGSSNDPLAEILNDTTGGARRFFDISAADDGRLIELSRTYDFTALWQSVPLDLKPAKADMEDIRKEQRRQRQKTPVELWYTDEGKQMIQERTPPATQAPTTGYPANELYSSFVQWCCANGEKQVSNTAFGRKLTSFGSVEKARNGAGNYYFMKHFKLDE